VEPKYQEIKAYKYGYAQIKEDDKWGYIDESGKVVVSPEYDELGIMRNGAVWGVKGKKKKKKFGVIKNDKFIVLEDVNGMLDLDENGIAMAKKGKKVGHVNKDGKWITEAKYKDAKTFYDGVAPVKEKKKWGYIDKNENWVIKPKYKDAEVFSKDGLAPV